MTRKGFFKKNVSYSKLYKHIKMVEFDEFHVDRWGNVCCFRVYGNSAKDFKLYER